MSDSTIDDALRLLEIGRGNPDRLKQIIESFETRSLISLQDRKYVEALVAQYLTPRHRVRIKKIDPIKKQRPDFPRIRKSTKPEFDFKENYIDSDKKDIEKPDLNGSLKKICPECGYENSVGNNFCNSCGSLLTKPESNTQQIEASNEPKNESTFEKYEREYIERQYGKVEESVKETGIEEKFIEYIEAKPTPDKKSNKKFLGIGIGILALIVIVGGGAVMIGDAGFFTAKTDQRLTCDNNPVLILTTKIPGFPNPENDLQYYLDRYNNEPSYKDWFDRNFPDQTIQEVLITPTSRPAPNNIPNFPDPENDLQYYLDRYNNEPSYKDWFDRNFPDQTIQDVIC